jgi:hypothetical protein
MPKENVEIGLAAVDAWNRGEREAWLALWDEGAAFYPLRAQLEGESYSGHEGLERFLAEMTEDWEEVRFEIEETRDAGEQVVGIGLFRAHAPFLGASCSPRSRRATGVGDGGTFGLAMRFSASGCDAF